MEEKKLSELTDEELLIKKKKLKQSKVFHALLIGFLVGIMVFGIVAWAYSRKLVGLVPVLFLAFLVRRIVKNSKNNKELEEILKARKLD